MIKTLFGTRVRRDLWWILVYAVLAYFLAERVNLFELLYSYSRSHEGWDLDELFTVAMLLPLPALVFVSRRFGEMQAEVVRRVAAEQGMRRLAQLDGLTGLPNRMLLQDRLERAIARAKRRRAAMLAVFFIDLDGFKAINDTHGHPAGDAILQEAARRIQAQVREQDTVARLGGDEFIVLIEETETLEQLEQVARRIIGEIGAPYCHHGQTMCLTASMGVSIYTGPTEENGSQLLERADQAMYQAKRKGKNQYAFFHPGLCG